ncbi:MAG: hypothetical protein LBL49_00040 [Clostridiales Family XIII bacterium]|jgi:epoxyqueuosine reductase|nr:hypothetical protein [Clostridiales Family XIII bacterium]
MNIEKSIQNKAYELGYERCGIIPIEYMDGYDERMSERISKVPESEGFYKAQSRLTHLREQYPWANLHYKYLRVLRQYASYSAP